MLSFEWTEQKILAEGTSVRDDIGFGKWRKNSKIFNDGIGIAFHIFL
jgi:hypothetical protein